MNFKFKFLTTTFVAILFANLAIPKAYAQPDQTDLGNTYLNIMLRATDSKVKSMFLENVNDACSCHSQGTRMRISQAKNENSALTDAQIGEDQNKIITDCRKLVMDTISSTRQGDVMTKFQQNFIDDAFIAWDAVVKNQLASNTQRVTLTNTALSVPIACTNEAEIEIDESLVTPEVDEAAVLDDAVAGLTSVTCYSVEDVNPRSDCLGVVSNPPVGAVDTVVTGNDFVPNPTDISTIVGEANPIDELIAQRMQEEQENLQAKIEQHCQCQAVQTKAQVLACLDLVNENYENGEATSGLDQWKGTLVCSSQQTAEFNQDSYLLNCLNGPEPGKCKERLNTRVGMLYCMLNTQDNLEACVNGLRDLVLDYNHRKVVDPCRDDVRPSSISTRNECEEIAAYQFLLNNHSVNFFQALCPIDWSGCDKEGDEKRCRPQIFGEFECKKRLVNQMLDLDDQLFKTNTMAGFSRGLTKARIVEKLQGEVAETDVTTPLSSASKFKSDKSNDGALLQMFAVENNMNHIDMDILTYCKHQELPEDIAYNNQNASEYMGKIITCYYNRNVYIADEELMDRVKEKYCKPQLYTSKNCGWTGENTMQCEKECMNRLISRTFSEVDPECLTKPNPMEQKLCSLKKNLTTLAENSFPVTSCFNELRFPNRDDRRNCQDIAKSLDEEVQACLKDNEFPLQCIDDLMKKSEPMAYHQECSDEQQQAGECFSILNEYINSMIAWNGLQASPEQCVQEGYANDQRGQLECEMMVLAQDDYSNSNSFIDRQFYCQTNETRSTGGTVECNDFSTVYVAQSSVSGLSAIGDGDLQNLNPPGPPGPIARTTGGNGSTGGSGGGRGSSSGANGAIPFAAVAGGSGLSYDDSPVVNVNGNEVGLNSSLLSGAKGNGFFGFLKDFKYVKFRHHPEEPCKALGKAALTRVIGTVAAGVTVYLVHKNVMKNYKKEKEQEPNDGSDPNNRAVHNTKNVQIKAMDHISQGYKGAIAGMGVKIGMNLIANSITRKAIANEQARMSSLRAQGLPATPTVCNSSDIPSRSERRANRRLNTMNEFILPSEKKPDLFVSNIERAQSEAELRIIFDEYTEFSTGYKVASLTEEEYRQKEFEYMLESVSTTESQQETVDILKSTFKTLITTTSEIIFPSAHAFIGGGGGGSIMTLMPLIMPIIANMGKKDESSNGSKGGSTNRGGSSGGNSCDTITREDVIAFKTGTTNPSASNCQPSPDDNEITGDGDSVDVITGGNEILANDTTSQDCGVLNDQSLQLAATRKARCDFGGDNCDAITVERSPAAGACGGQPEPATSGES